MEVKDRRREFRRVDGSVIQLDPRPRGTAGRRRARSQRCPRLRRVVAKVGAFLTATQARVDMALAGISALLVIGTVFITFAFTAWAFGYDKDLATNFWLIGFGCWAIAAGIFFWLMNDPYPKHRKGR